MATVTAEAVGVGPQRPRPSLPIRRPAVRPSLLPGLSMALVAVGASALAAPDLVPGGWHLLAIAAIAVGSYGVGRGGVASGPDEAELAAWASLLERRERSLERREQSVDAALTTLASDGISRVVARPADAARDAGREAPPAPEPEPEPAGGERGGSRRPGGYAGPVPLPSIVRAELHVGEGLEPGADDELGGAP